MEICHLCFRWVFISLTHPHISAVSPVHLQSCLNHMLHVHHDLLANSVSMAFWHFFFVSRKQLDGKHAYWVRLFQVVLISKAVLRLTVPPKVGYVQNKTCTSKFTNSEKLSFLAYFWRHGESGWPTQPTIPNHQYLTSWEWSSKINFCKSGPFENTYQMVSSS